MIFSQASSLGEKGFTRFPCRRALHTFVKTPGAMDEYFDGIVPNALIQTFGDLLTGYYSRLQADQGKADASFFAEKASPRDAVRDGAQLFDGRAREILLVRDPRDILCSANSFWKSRREAAIRNITVTTTRLEEIYAEDSSHTLMVKYEDLVTDTSGTLAKIWDFLGAGDTPVATNAKEDSSLFNRHGTSKSPTASIGRWRTELATNEIALCDQAFGSFLDRLGYSRT